MENNAKAPTLQKWAFLHVLHVTPVLHLNRFRRACYCLPMSRTLALAVCLAPLSCCVPHREVLERGLTASRDLAVAAEPCLVATRQAQLDACSSDAACLEKVRTSYAKLADSLDALHAAWCALSPTAEGCS